MASSSNPLIDLMLGSPSKLPNYDGINLLDKPIIFANIGDVVMVISFFVLLLLITILVMYLKMDKMIESLENIRNDEKLIKSECAYDSEKSLKNAMKKSIFD